MKTLKTETQNLIGIALNSYQLSLLDRYRQELDEWNDLSSEQQQGILDAIEELNNGKGIPHEQVISKYRKKYSDG